MSNGHLWGHLESTFVYWSFYNTRLHNETQVVVPSCYTGKKQFLCWSTDNELRSLTAWGKKLLCMVVWQQILLYLLPDSSRVNRLWLGWVLSISILRALQASHLTDITQARYLSISDVLGSFNHPLQSPHTCFQSESFLLLLCKS